MTARQPSTHWSESDGWHRLGDDTAVVFALVYRQSDGAYSWGVCSGGVMFIAGRTGKASNLDAAKLAAEDALLAVRDEIARAVGQ